LKAHAKRLALVAGFVLSPFGFAQAGTVRGTVKNGTTGKPAEGIEIILIQLQGGMQPVVNSKTDAQGQFTFDHPSLGAQPMLVRAVYRGVNFHQPVPPGTNELQVEVFDPTQDARTITVPSHVVIFQPDGAALIVGEEYSIQNRSHPPMAYFRAEGNFDFLLPDKADLQQVSAWGPSGMPVVQATIDRGKNRYAVAFAFRPGESGVRYSYKLPYPGNAATVKIPNIYPGGRLLVVAPPTVHLSGEGLTAAGQEQGMSIYQSADVSANTSLAVKLSGTAPLPAAASGGSDGGGLQGGSDAPQGGGAAAGVNIQQIPGRLDVLKWQLVAGFIVVFALGAILLARKPVTVVANVAPEVIENVLAVGLAKKPTASTTQQAQASLAQVDAAVGTSLDSLKDTLFLLELRRQAGTISEEEYGRERARAEKVLRDLVRG
jgi:hypothetical protein